ncbi:MAG: hypothetical protein ABSG67_19355 [Thermoguttaceae bacterium]|jgi:hypothetical protein
MVCSVLQRHTLVLNRNWQPVHVATVARSLVLLWNESARVVVLCSHLMGFRAVLACPLECCMMALKTSFPAAFQHFVFRYGILDS